MSPETVESPKPHIECAGGCPPYHRVAKRVSVSIVGIMLALLVISVIYLFMSGGYQ